MVIYCCRFVQVLPIWLVNHALAVMLQGELKLLRRHFQKLSMRFVACLWVKLFQFLCFLSSYFSYFIYYFFFWIFFVSGVLWYLFNSLSFCLFITAMGLARHCMRKAISGWCYNQNYQKKDNLRRRMDSIPL